MVMLFLLILILIGRAITLPGAIDGVITFLNPDFSKVNAKMIIEAMGLAFFSMSLGMGCMITYGSYASSDTYVPHSAGSVITLTTLICFLSGLMVFPAIFVFGFDPSAGPGLTFITMPAVFSQMGGGQFFGILFFFLLFVAALTSSVSLMEVVVSFFIDEFNCPRTATTIIMSILMFILGIAASLSMGVWQDYKLFGKNFFDILDYISSNLIMPFGGIMVAILVGWKSWTLVAEQFASQGRNPWWLPLLKWFLRIIAPVMIFVVLLQNL